MYYKLTKTVNKIIIKLRTMHYRAILGQLGNKSLILGSIKIYGSKNLLIGNHTTINHGVIINARDSITIGNYVHVSPGCILNTGGLDYTKTEENRVHIQKPIVIKDGAWIGSGVIINPGVTVGENSVLGAGSVVTKDIPKNTVALGVPARVVKEIDKNQ